MLIFCEIVVMVYAIDPVNMSAQRTLSSEIEHFFWSLEIQKIRESLDVEK